MNCPLVGDTEQKKMGTIFRRLRGLIAIALQSAALLAICAGGTETRADQFVRLDYNLTLNSRSRDTAFIQVFDDRPLTSANFMQYVNLDKYDGMFMHRLSRSFVIQGGGFYPVIVDEPPPVNASLDPNAKVDLDNNPATPNPMVMNEYSLTPVRSNVRGTLAMARVGGQPNSATSEWFVNLKDNSFLDTVDGGFTVFASVLGDGMSLFDAFNGLSIFNLNPDVDDNGTRDGGPFYNYQAPAGTDGVPVLNNNLVQLQDAERIDYLGLGSTTTVPIGGLTFDARDSFIDTGAILDGPGALTIGANRTMGIREGFSLTRPLINNGTLAPGLQLGSITVQTYLQTATGTLDIQLRGVTADPEHDRLVVTGNTSIAGKLDVSLISGFTPAAGHSFTVLTAGSITGSFSTIELPQLTAGLVWRVNQTPTALTLSVAKADYNLNGVVDAADFVVWRNLNGLSGSGLAADGNGDNQVDNDDYIIWRQNFGNHRGTATGAGSLVAAAVPEPSTVILSIAVTSIFSAIRRRRQN